MMRRCRRDSHHVYCLLIRDGRWACLGVSGGACRRGATGDHARHRLAALAAGRVRR